MGNPTVPLVRLLGLGKFQTAARRTLDILPLYKEVKTYHFLSMPDPSLPLPRVTTPKVQSKRSGPSTMSGSNLQGWWMASFVTEEDIKKLREARYLTAEILHRLPAQGQVIPTPEPNESVVFISHFL